MDGWVEGLDTRGSETETEDSEVGYLDWLDVFCIVISMILRVMEVCGWVDWWTGGVYMIMVIILLLGFVVV